MADNFYDELYESWKKYFHCYVAGNEHLEKPMFHSLIGILFTSENARLCYLTHGSYFSMRIHPFMLQPSGSGKSETVRCHNNLLTSINYELSQMGIKLNLKSELTTKMTDAGLLGSVDKKGNLIFGALSNDNVIYWDEGSVLFRDDNFTSGTRDTLQMALDEKGGGMGQVSKRLGSIPNPISYPSRTTLIAGSYLTPSMNKTIFNEGLFQRLYLTFKEYTYDDLRVLRRQVMELKRIDKFRDIDPIVKKINEIIYQLVDFCNRTYSKSGHTNNIRFNEGMLTEFYDMLDKMIEAKTKGAFDDKGRQDILNTFSNRAMLCADKFAAQHAILFKKPEVELDDYKYGVEMAGQHLDSIYKILECVGKVQYDTKKNYENIVIECLTANPGITQKTLVSLLRGTNGTPIMGWDKSFNKTLEFLNEMEKDGKIVCKQGSNNSKLYYPFNG